MKNKKQSAKILSLTLLLSLLCAAAPFSALAKENTPDTAADTTQDIIIDDDTLSADHGTWAWDSGSNTLTLKGIDLKADGPAGIQIKVAPYVYLEIAPGTQNKISLQSSARNCSGIIKDNGNLIIRGSGSLSITTDDFGIASSYASLFIEGEPTIQITAVQGAGKTFGIYANEKFEMNGGSLAVSDFTTGVLANEGIAFKGGTTEINNPSTAGESITARTAAGALTVASPLEYWGQSGFEYTAGSVEILRLPEVYQDTFIDLKTKKPASSVKIFTPPTPINNAEISITGGPFTFTGAPKEPEIRVMINDKALQEGVDYKIDTYTDNINAGTAKVKIRGILSYTGTTEQSFVIEAATLTSEDVSEIKGTFTENGIPQEPKPAVTQGTAILKEYQDYTLKYSNNTKATVSGSEPAKVTVIGTGNYKGSVERTFTINAPAPMPVPTPTPVSNVKTGIVQTKIGTYCTVILLFTIGAAAFGIKRKRNHK